MVPDAKWDRKYVLPCFPTFLPHCIRSLPSNLLRLLLYSLTIGLSPTSTLPASPTLPKSPPSEPLTPRTSPFSERSDPSARLRSWLDILTLSKAS
jgi:hypothetical protein